MIREYGLRFGVWSLRLKENKSQSTPNHSDKSEATGQASHQVTPNHSDKSEATGQASYQLNIIQNRRGGSWTAHIKEEDLRFEIWNFSVTFHYSLFTWYFVIQSPLWAWNPVFVFSLFLVFHSSLFTLHYSLFTCFYCVPRPIRINPIIMSIKITIIFFPNFIKS